LRLVTFHVCCTTRVGALVALVAFVALATPIILHTLYCRHMTFSQEQQQHVRKLFIDECRQKAWGNGRETASP
jgi:hypothetical protein